MEKGVGGGGGEEVKMSRRDVIMGAQTIKKKKKSLKRKLANSECSSRKLKPREKVKCVDGMWR